MYSEIIKKVNQEIEKQNTKWGEQNYIFETENKIGFHVASQNIYKSMNDDPEFKKTWYNVLMEEVEEAFSTTDKEERKKELVQVAALAIQIIHYLDKAEV